MRPDGSRGDRTLLLVQGATLAAGAAALIAAALPGEALANLFTLVDADRSRRPLPIPVTALRAGLAAAGALMLAVGWSVRRLGSRLPGRTGAPSPDADLEAPWTTWTRWEVATLIGLIGLAVLLRSYRLLLPLGTDESYTFVFYASRSLLDVVSDYATPNNHIFHTVLVWLSTNLFGVHPLALRAPTFLAGVAAVPMAYWLVRREGAPLAALAFTAFMAVGAPFVEYAGRARGYALLLVLLLWCLLAARDLVRGRGGWPSFVIASALGCWTVPIFLLPLGGIGLWLVWERRDRTFLLHLAGAVAIAGLGTLLLYSPAIARTGLDKLLSPDAWQRQSMDQVLAIASRQSALLGRCWGGGLGPLGLPLAAALVGATLVGWRRGNPWARLALLCVGWFLALALLRGIKLRSRVVDWFLPIWLLGSVTSVRFLARERPPRARRVGMAAILLLAGAWSFVQLRSWMVQGAEGGGAASNVCVQPYYVDARPVAESFTETRRPGDVIVAPYGSGMVLPLRFHLMEEGLPPTLVTASTTSPAQGTPLPLAGFRRWFVAVPLERWDPSAPLPALAELESGVAEDVDRVARALGFADEELRALVETVEVWRDFRNTRVFRVDLRPEVVEAHEPPSPREIMRTSW